MTALRIPVFLAGLFLLLLSLLLIAVRQQAPQSPWIAVASDINGGELMIVRPDGSQSRIISQENLHPVFVLWSPDGRWIAYNTSRAPELFLVRPNGRDHQVLLPTIGFWFDWSPDSQQVVYMEKGDLFIQGLQGESARLELPNIDFPDEPIWSPDGQQIVVSDDVQDNLKIIQADGDRDTLLADQARTIFPAVWSPDSNWIALTVWEGRMNQDLQVLRRDGSERHSIRVPNRITYSPSWSPQGGALTFVGEGLQSDIYRASLGGGSVVNLTAHPAADLRPAWSPDGKWIAFASDRDGGWRLYRVPAAGGAVEQVTQYKIENTFFDWSPVIDLPWRSGWNVLGAALILGLWAILYTVSKAALPQTAL